MYQTSPWALTWTVDHVRGVFLDARGLEGSAGQWTENPKRLLALTPLPVYPLAWGWEHTCTHTHTDGAVNRRALSQQVCSSSSGGSSCTGHECSLEVVCLHIVCVCMRERGGERETGRVKCHWQLHTCLGCPLTYQYKKKRNWCNSVALPIVIVKYEMCHMLIHLSSEAKMNLE